MRRKRRVGRTEIMCWW